MDASTPEESDVYVPGALTWARLTLRGRTPRAGVLPVHNHPGSTADSANATHGHTADATATADAAQATNNGSVNHDHGGSATAESGGTGHGHNISGGSHDHGSTSAAGGPHTHQFAVSNTGATTMNTGILPFTAPGLATPASESNGTHGHDVPTSSSHAHTNTNSAHTHPIAVDGSAHTHPIPGHDHPIAVTDANAAHGHAATIPTQGVGGSLIAIRPASVTVAINGVDRTSALGGPWGSSGADWDVVDLNVLAYLLPEAWNRITVQSTTVGRLKLHVTARLS